MEEITRIRNKRLDGLALTLEERRFLTKYYHRYAPCKLTLHVRETTRATWLAEAQAKGMPLSNWDAQRNPLSRMPVPPEPHAAKR